MGDEPRDLARLLTGHAPPVAALVRRLRQEILEIIPDASERVYLGWRGLGFHHPTAGYVCALFPHGDHVKVGFEQGRRLHDPDGLLTGRGIQVRYLVVAEWTDDLVGILDGFLVQAVDLGQEDVGHEARGSSRGSAKE